MGFCGNFLPHLNVGFILHAVAKTDFFLERKYAYIFVDSQYNFLICILIVFLALLCQHLIKNVLKQCYWPLGGTKSLKQDDRQTIISAALKSKV